MGRRIISRAEAIRQNLSLYFTGKPCLRGHVALRLVAGSYCRKCNAIARSRIPREVKAARDRAYRKKYAKRYAKKQRENYQKNREARLAWCRRYYRRNRERIKKRNRAYVLRNIKRTQRYQRRWGKKNSHRVRVYRRSHYVANRVAYIQRARRWGALNPQSKMNAVRRRRRRLKAIEGSFTAKDVARILRRQHGKCANPLCGLMLSKYEIDHVVPITRGGSNWPSNIQLLCKPCNRRKYTLTMQEWLQRQLEENGQRISNKTFRRRRRKAANTY